MKIYLHEYNGIVCMTIMHKDWHTGYEFELFKLSPAIFAVFAQTETTYNKYNNHIILSRKEL